MSLPSAYLEALKLYLETQLGFDFDWESPSVLPSESPKGFITLIDPKPLGVFGQVSNSWTAAIVIYISGDAMLGTKYAQLDLFTELERVPFNLSNNGVSGTYRSLAVTNILKGVDTVGAVTLSAIDSAQRSDLNDRNVQARIEARFDFRIEG